MPAQSWSASLIATRVLWTLALLVAVAPVGCGGDSQGPTTPTPPPTAPPTSPPPPPSTPTAFTVTGRVVSSTTGAPIGGARLVTEVGTTTTAGDGSFRFSSTTNPQFTPYGVEVAADGYVTRNAYLHWERTRAGLEIDLLPATPPFSLDFYRQFVRNGFEGPEDLQVVRRLQTSPSVYIQTVDADGRTIDPFTLDMVEGTIRRSVPAFSGGTLSIVSVERGAARREPTNGWIVVDFVDQPDANFCGQAFVGAAAGHVTLNYNQCGCGSLRVRPSTVAHETGHALGFWHVRDAQHIMAAGRQKPCPSDEPTADELFHARLAYKRAIGNRDPDQDTQAGALARPLSMPAGREVTCFLP